MMVIKAKLKEFEEMDDMSFQFLNSAVSKMTFGIKELKKCVSVVRRSAQICNFPTEPQVFSLFMMPLKHILKNKLLLQKHFQFTRMGN
jgi:hypothetical protein